MDGRSYSTWNLVNLGFIFFNYLVWNVRKFDSKQEEIIIITKFNLKRVKFW